MSALDTMGDIDARAELAESADEEYQVSWGDLIERAIAREPQGIGTLRRLQDDRLPILVDLQSSVAL